MKDDGSGAPLSRRVLGSTRPGPSQPVRPVFSDTDMHRIRAAIDAEHANAEMPSQQEPNTEPLARVTDSSPRTKQTGSLPATAERAAKPPRLTKPPRVEESLRVAKALQAAEELRAAEKPRAAKRATEQGSIADGRLRPEEPVRAEEPVRVLEPVPRGGSRRGRRPGRWTASGWWRYRTATLVAFGAVLLAAGALVRGMFLQSPLTGTGAHAATSAPKAGTHATVGKSKRHATRRGSAASGSTKIKHTNPAVATNRRAAAAWVAQQVGTAAVVACDAPTCAALRSSGFLAGHQVQIGVKSKSLSNAGLVVVTPELRTLISPTHPNLGAEVAPTDLASFGGGNAKVTVQVVYPAGAAAYETALRQNVQTRMKVGEQLLNTGKVSASAAAESDLKAGAVDPRLLLVIEAMAHLEPVDVVGFSDSGPGASAGVPFRLMALGESDPAALVSASGYLQAMLHLLQAHATFPAFNHVGQATLSGQKVVEVEYAAPSPLGS